MTRRIQPLNLLPLSWGKTICVGRGSVPKIIEVMLQRPYGVRGLGRTVELASSLFWRNFVYLSLLPFLLCLVLFPLLPLFCCGIVD
jgi:hypothetical protein